MELGQLIHKVQKLSQDAGLSFNTMKPAEAKKKLIELRGLLTEQELLAPTPAAEKTEAAEETEDAADETEEKTETATPGPEAQPSEQ